MATQPESSRPTVANKPGRSTYRSSAVSRLPKAAPPTRFRHRRNCASLRSADLAGRSVALSPDIPATFDVPLAPHHKLIGRWVDAREPSARTYTRPQARRHIEQVFNAAVLEVLDPIEFVDLRAVVLRSEENGPPAIAVVNQNMGQLDLGWIEDSDAPIPWRAAAYKALDRLLGRALPVFGYDELFEYISMYYWDGAIDDENARQWIIDYNGANPDDLDEYSMPSEMNARRPAWMIAAAAASLARLPSGLRQKIRAFRDAHRALGKLPPECNAWHLDLAMAYEYLPEIEEYSLLPPLTLVPLEQFAREIDDVARHGMEMGFMDIAGLCPLPDETRIDDWFASLRVGARFLLAAQDLIRFDPANP